MDFNVVYFGLGFLFCMVMDIGFAIANFFLRKAAYYRNLKSLVDKERKKEG